jgi:hypothetical protein
MLKGQKTILDQVFNAWSRARDRVRAFALIGAAMSPRFAQNRKFCYADDEFNEAFAEATNGFHAYNVEQLRPR